MAAQPELKNMRAVHMEGNWGGNVQGIRTAVWSFLRTAPSLSAGSTRVSVGRSTSVDSFGKRVRSDVAQVRFDIVVVGSRPFTQAGFWLVRDVDTQQIYLTFHPALDSSLRGIPGFASDVTVVMSADGRSIDTVQIERASGAAFDYIAAVIAHAHRLIEGGTVVVNPPATFDRSAVIAALQKLRNRIETIENEYFEFLKSLNVQWLGISVALFYDSIADPAVRVRYRPAGETRGIYTYHDADLRNFIIRAKELGFSVYLTLAFEPSDIPVSMADPTCNTPAYKPNRWLVGRPAVDRSDSYQACINPALWWWDPNHPDHARNVSAFWNTYTELAVKYAALSQQLGVDMLSLGTETENLFRSRPAQGPYTNDFRAQLTAMVAAVRNVYSGLLTYDQHYDVLVYPRQYGGGAGSTNLFTDIALDVVSISAYFRLVNTPPTEVLLVEWLESAWENIFAGYLAPLQDAYPDKPIVFTEFGYTDDVGSPANPQANMGAPLASRNEFGVTDGMVQQQNIFKAFFNVNRRFNDLVGGAFIWGNQVFSNAPWLCNQVYFNLYCKPSAQTIREIYSR